LHRYALVRAGRNSVGLLVVNLYFYFGTSPKAKTPMDAEQRQTGNNSTNIQLIFIKDKKYFD
jgi:hypothetical protein